MLKGVAGPVPLPGQGGLLEDRRVLATKPIQNAATFIVAINPLQH
jgi:hypothetical protein